MYLAATELQREDSIASIIDEVNGEPIIANDIETKEIHYDKKYS